MAASSSPIISSSPRRIGYVRVFPDEQNLDLQRDALRVAGVEEVREERAGGRRRDRPVLETLLQELQAGDVLVTWKVDRVARSTKHLVEILGDLQSRRIGFVSLTQAIDTTSAMGPFFVALLAAVAERVAKLQADEIRERVAAERKVIPKAAADVADELEDVAGRVAETLADEIADEAAKAAAKAVADEAAAKAVAELAAEAAAKAVAELAALAEAVAELQADTDTIRERVAAGIAAARRRAQFEVSLDEVEQWLKPWTF
jgi:DNA invertase Pin-like site-specific DNA recombinase